jgi:hypothetical protein
LRNSENLFGGLAFVFAPDTAEFQAKSKAETYKPSAFDFLLLPFASKSLRRDIFYTSCPNRRKTGRLV